MSAGLTKNKNPLQFNLCKSRRKTHFADFNLIEAWRSLFRRQERRISDSVSALLTVDGAQIFAEIPPALPALTALRLPCENLLTSRWTRNFQTDTLKKEEGERACTYAFTSIVCSVQCTYFFAKQRWGHLQRAYVNIHIAWWAHRGQSSVFTWKYTIFHWIYIYIYIPS